MSSEDEDSYVDVVPMDRTEWIESKMSSGVSYTCAKKKGHVKLAKYSTKKLQRTTQSQKITYTIVSGEIRLTIGKVVQKYYDLKKGDIVTVGYNTFYSIHNRASRDSLISYTII